MTLPSQVSDVDVDAVQQGPEMRLSYLVTVLADSDGLVLDRLAYHLQHPWPEIGQLVQEEHAPVGQRYLAEMEPFTTADQSGMAGRNIRNF